MRSRLVPVIVLEPRLHDAELGHFLHPCEGDLVCRCTNEKIPYFNAPVYLENKSQIGKVDDIFGPMNEFVSSTAEMHVETLCVWCVLALTLISPLSTSL